MSGNATETHRMPRGKILSLGSINADFQMRTARRPEVSETLLASDFVRLGGGKAANVAYLAAKLGAPAQLLARVGDDDLAEQALAPLRAAGIDLRGIVRVAHAGTGVTMITVPPDGKKSIVMAANANQAWNAADAEAVRRAVAGLPAASVLAADCEIPVPVLEPALRAARQAGVVTVLDPSPADRAGALLALSDYLAPNAGEAAHLTGIACDDVAAAIAAGRRLRECGVGTACVKLVDGGCVTVAPAEVFHVPPVPVEVVDTTGAGDAFTGALAVALLERRPCAEAVRFAVAASHLAVTAYGSQPAYPDRKRVEQMAARLDVRMHDGRQ